MSEKKVNDIVNYRLDDDQYPFPLSGVIVEKHFSKLMKSVSYSVLRNNSDLIDYVSEFQLLDENGDPEM